MDRLMLTFADTIIQFQGSLHKHMPSTPYRDFHLWAISSENGERETWLQVMGIPQFAKLTEHLLGEVVADEQWPLLLKYAGVMNNYLIYETISDNLAIGLAYPHPDDETYEIRKSILRTFNEAMALRLKGEKAHSKKLLASIKTQAGQVSAFKQSLTEDDQRDLVLHYAQQIDSPTWPVEFGTWAALVANIEACVDVIEELQGNALYDSLRDELIARYEAVSCLLNQAEMDIEDLKHTSTQAILVVPVLTYYISVIAEIINPNPAIIHTLEGRVLQTALEDAALMVRLLNDIGTGLLTAKHDSERMFDNLHTHSHHINSMSLCDFLLQATANNGEMSRIHKDITYGEYNVSLYNIMDAPLTPETFLIFRQNVTHFQACYRDRRTRLKQNLAKMTDILDNPTISNLILRFVKFHEYIYSYSFDSQAGDYATKPDRAQLIPEGK